MTFVLNNLFFLVRRLNLFSISVILLLMLSVSTVSLKVLAQSPPGSTGTPTDSTETPTVSTETPPDSTETPPDSTETPPDSTETPPDSTETPTVSTETPDTEKEQDDEKSLKIMRCNADSVAAHGYEIAFPAEMGELLRSVLSNLSIPNTENEAITSFVTKWLPKIPKAGVMLTNSQLIFFENFLFLVDQADNGALLNGIFITELGDGEIKYKLLNEITTTFNTVEVLRNSIFHDYATSVLGFVFDNVAYVPNSGPGNSTGVYHPNGTTLETININEGNLINPNRNMPIIVFLDGERVVHLHLSLPHTGEDGELELVSQIQLKWIDHLFGMYPNISMTGDLNTLIETGATPDINGVLMDTAATKLLKKRLKKHGFCGNSVPVTFSNGLDYSKTIWGHVTFIAGQQDITLTGGANLRTLLNSDHHKGQRTILVSKLLNIYRGYFLVVDELKGVTINTRHEAERVSTILSALSESGKELPTTFLGLIEAYGTNETIRDTVNTYFSDERSSRTLYFFVSMASGLDVMKKGHWDQLVDFFMSVKEELEDRGLFVAKNATGILDGTIGRSITTEGYSILVSDREHIVIIREHEGDLRSLLILLEKAGWNMPTDHMTGFFSIASHTDPSAAEIVSSMPSRSDAFEGGAGVNSTEVRPASSANIQLFIGSQGASFQ